ncbi:glycosyltransferase family 2 protein [Cryobacterium sp. Hh7]|nr:glycosyltransferase family 2 protein [Cryobacterium sp. Hh7]
MECRAKSRPWYPSAVTLSQISNQTRLAPPPCTGKGLIPTVSFAPESQPVVSVIVLAWRLVDPLLEALESVSRSVDAPPYEVIVVLNGALPNVRQAVRAQVAGVRVVDVEANTGFGDGCNRGAALARGRFLLFLNDDAVVAPSMITALVTSADSSATGQSIGAVAAVLLNGDGTIQEAGSRMVSTAGTVQLGAGIRPESPDAAPYLLRRPIDYGSGAALLVQRDVFTTIGGYDTRYRPAYFEDADLAFRLKALGLSVILEPVARAPHLSGASTERDLRFRQFASHRAGLAFIEHGRMYSPRHHSPTLHSTSSAWFPKRSLSPFATMIC